MRTSGVVSNTPPVCPVCRWPDQGDAVCDRCGWELRGGYVVGWASPDDERELAAQITDERRRHDLRAAVHAAGCRGHRDHEVLFRLCRLARGGQPRASEINSAIAEIDAEEPLVGPVATGTGFALRRLVAEDIEAIAFVEISADAVSVEILVTDELGVPVRKPGSDSLAWQHALDHTDGSIGRWTIWPRDDVSKELLVEWTHQLVSEQVFPEASSLGVAVALRWRFIGDLTGSKYLHAGYCYGGGPLRKASSTSTSST